MQRHVAGTYGRTLDVPRQVFERWTQAHEHESIRHDKGARVAFVPFADACRGRHELGNTAKKVAYEEFLEALWDMATGLMLPKQKNDLGKHCFGYATLVHEEYYHGLED